MQRWLFIACLFCLAALPAFAVEGSGDGTPSMTGDQSKVIRHVGMLQAACIFWRTQQLSTKRARDFVQSVMDRTPAPADDPGLRSRMRDLVVEPRFGGNLSCLEIF
jgi:hypothetical protein